MVDILVAVVVGCPDKSRLVGKSSCPLVASGTIGGMPSVGIVLRDPNSYLREFRRKRRKTPNGSVNKRDRELNPASPVLPV